LGVVREGSNDGLLALSETFRAFAEATTDYATVLATVAQKLTDLIGDACVVSLADEDGMWMEPSAACARDPEATAILRAALARVAERDGTGQTVSVVRTGQPVLVPEIDPEALASRAEPAFADAVRQLRIRSFLSVPLEVRGRRLGALSLFRYIPGSPPFGEYDRALALTISDHAALTIANAQLIESLQRELRERKKAEEQAKTFVALIENSTDMIAMADFAGRVLFVNAAGRALVGIAADRDVRDMTLADFHTADGLGRGDIIRERGQWQGEGVLRHQQTGEMIATQISSFLVRDSHGEAMCFATVQHDLRATKRLESELRQAQKMEALGRLAGGVAHDFNNLLTVILSYSSMLAKALPRDSRNAADVEQIERAAHRAAELTRQLLAFSRRQVLEPTPLDLGTTLRAMDGMIRRLIGEDIELRIRTATDPCTVMVDAGQVEQVLMNLVVNARDAMHGGGVLTLETARVELTAGTGGELGLDPGAYNTLSITDTGTGIDDQTKPHLFEPFFTTKDRGKGTGLGLSTVMGIVKQSGGHITVDTAVGKGSTFRVYLPAIASVTLPAPALPRTLTPIWGVHRILVVEDEVEVRVLICNVLRQAGYEVLDAIDGEHALQISAATPGEIHLLLTDVIMPRLGGRQLAAKFLERRPASRVLYMSGYTDDKLGHHGVLDPDVELIQKPLTPDALLRRVREILKPA
jgi:two-component system, cell cycle sensor histidine kinase and response regulator CckA